MNTSELQTIVIGSHLRGAFQYWGKTLSLKRATCSFYVCARANGKLALVTLRYPSGDRPPVVFAGVVVRRYEGEVVAIQKSITIEEGDRIAATLLLNGWLPEGCANG